MRADDVEPLLGVFTDPNVMAVFGVPAFDRDQMARWVRRNLDHQSRYGYGLFAVILKANGLLIGDCGLEHMALGDEPATELGYDLRSAYWNQGLATEAAAAVRDFAFVQLKLPRLVSLIRHGNLASRRVAEKIGMRLDAEIVRHAQPYWVYAINRSAGNESPRRPDSVP
jgi:RimJ/RimL family protein N-acetyltransferase